MKDVAHIVEALLFSADGPLKVEQVLELLPETDGAAVEEAFTELRDLYDDTSRAFCLVPIAGGYQLLTRPDAAPWVEKFLVGRRRKRLSRAALEVLAVVSYRQPVTRGDVETIRGVDCGGVFRTLLERRLVAVKGRAKTVGHPLLYVTTDRFLEHFGIEDEAMLREKLDVDIFSVRPVYTGPHAENGLDSFGAPVDDIYGADGVGYGVGRIYPLADAKTVAEVENFAWPNAADFDYRIAATLLRGIPDDKAKRIDGKYGIGKPGKTLEEAAGGGPWLPLICNLFNLFGLENTLVNFACQPRLIETAVKKTEEFTLEFFRRLCEATTGLAELAYYGDDFATQRGLLISPEHWRRFLKPTYKKVFELLKGHGLKVWFHSCGQFRPVMGDLIDVGMDVWETVQTHLPGNEPEVRCSSASFSLALEFI